MRLPWGHDIIIIIIIIKCICISFLFKDFVDTNIESDTVIWDKLQQILLYIIKLLFIFSLLFIWKSSILKRNNKIIKNKINKAVGCKQA